MSDIIHMVTTTKILLKIKQKNNLVNLLGFKHKTKKRYNFFKGKYQQGTKIKRNFLKKKKNLQKILLIFS